MVRGMTRLSEISGNVARDQLNVGKYVTKLSDVCLEIFRAAGSMFEQEHLRLINIFAAAGGGGSGGGSHKFVKGSWSTRSSSTSER